MERSTRIMKRLADMILKSGRMDYTTLPDGSLENKICFKHTQDIKGESIYCFRLLAFAGKCGADLIPLRDR